MSVALAVLVFVAGALVSLSTSSVLISRLERVGERVGLTEGILGVVAALAADAPEITVAITALAHNEQRVGAGVVIGSNVFNLAALLGLGAVVAGRISLHRKVVVLGGVVTMWIACACLAAVFSLVSPLAGFVISLVGLVLYVFALGEGRGGLGRLPLPRRWVAWLGSAVAEEELELAVAIHPQRGRFRDAVIAGASLLVVVAASVAMERAASALGQHYGVSEIVLGAVVLAAVTSLPNAVAANHLAAKGRGAAVLSTALNSNNLNITLGLLLPAAFVGLGRPSSHTTLVAAWYVFLTAFVLALAYRDRGLSRGDGLLIIGAYLVFVGSLLAVANATSIDPRISITPPLVLMAVAMWMMIKQRHGSGGVAEPPMKPGRETARSQPATESSEGFPNGDRRSTTNGQVNPHPEAARQATLLPGWSANQLWTLSLGLSAIVAATDALLADRVVLIGLLVIGPCCALLTGRLMQTALTSVVVIALAVFLGLPDGVWGTGTHLAFIGAVVVVSLVSTLAAAIIDQLRAST